MIPYSIFIVDDEEPLRIGISIAFGKKYRVKTFPDAETAMEAVRGEPPDLVLLDLGLPGLSGLDILPKIKERNPETMVIVITAYEDVKSVVSAMKMGAYDYIVKPLDVDALEVTVRNALETVRLKKEVRELQERCLKDNLPCFIGESHAIRDVMDFVEAIAKSPDTPVLILGETGTGKELVAGAIHYRSPNFKGPLISVNCAAIPKELIESELFGYERGAFTGASLSGKKGLVEQAEDGTLFLDEVGDLSLEAQAKLLRFLEDGGFFRVGGTKKLRIRTRVISATNKDPESLFETGQFRKDLFYRLAVVKVEVPSLNQRRGDILPIARHFLVEFSRKFDKSITGISPEAEKALSAKQWSGNVRELKNLIERGALTGKGPELTVRDLGLSGGNGDEAQERNVDGYFSPPLSPSGMDMSSVRASLEKYYFEEALRVAGGVETRAAQLLNLNHQTFRYRRVKLGI